MSLDRGFALLMNLLLALVCLACGPGERAAEARVGALSQPPPLELAAAASLAELAQEVASGWEARSGVPVRVRLAASSTLARQIRAGSETDLFLSASADWVDSLDVIARKAWLGNRLALVAAGDQDIMRGEIPRHLQGLQSLALAEPGVPVGQAAEAALASMGIALPSRVMRGAHARDVLSKVSQGAAPAGIVYVTDAQLDDGVGVLAVLPIESHPPIHYEAALLRPAARDLFDALDQRWALDLAKARGFLTQGEGNP